MTGYTNTSMQCIYPIFTALICVNLLTFIHEKKSEKGDLKDALVRTSEPQTVKPILHNTVVHA